MANKEVTIYESAPAGSMPSAHEMQVFQTLAKSAVKSPLYKHLDECTALMIILAARELGVPPMLALNGGIHAIQGKIELSARLMTQLIRRAGHSIKFIQNDATICTLEGKRADNGDLCTVSFTWEEAVKAGLTKNPTWTKYPADMLYSRAISRLSRRLFADVIGTAYVEGEISTKTPIEIEEKEGNPEEKLLGYFTQEEAPRILDYVKHLAQEYKKEPSDIATGALSKIDIFKRKFLEWVPA